MDDNLAYVEQVWAARARPSWNVSSPLMSPELKWWTRGMPTWQWLRPASKTRTRTSICKSWCCFRSHEGEQWVLWLSYISCWQVRVCFVSFRMLIYADCWVDFFGNFSWQKIFPTFSAAVAWYWRGPQKFFATSVPRAVEFRKPDKVLEVHVSQVEVQRSSSVYNVGDKLIKLQGRNSTTIKLSYSCVRMKAKQCCLCDTRPLRIAQTRHPRFYYILG